MSSHEEYIKDDIRIVSRQAGRNSIVRPCVKNSSKSFGFNSYYFEVSLYHTLFQVELKAFWLVSFYTVKIRFG